MSHVQVILDTNIVSYLMRGGQLAQDYDPHIQTRLLSIAFFTLGELYFGAEKAKWGKKRRTQLETTLRNYVVIPYDHEIARCYGRLVAYRELVGRRIASNDAWIAACAVRHNIPLITHNARHFRGTPGLDIITESNLNNWSGNRS